MILNIDPLPEDADAGLAAIHDELAGVLATFEAGMAQADNDIRRTPIAKSVGREHAERNALAELDRLSRDLQRERETFERRRHGIGRITPPTSDRLARYIEIRETLRGLSDAKRVGVLQQARSRRDEITLSAVMDGPAFLCGLTDEEHRDFCEQAREALHGDELREADEALVLADQLTKQIEDVRRFIAGYQEETLANAV